MRFTLPIMVGGYLFTTSCDRTVQARPDTLVNLSVTARDFTFDAPDTIRARAVRLAFHNQGPSYHHVQIVRLTREIPFASVRDSLPAAPGPLPAWLVSVGGAEGADSIARPVTVSLPLPPGRYLLLCRITTPEKRPHYALGMVRSLVVLPPASRIGPALGADTTVIVRDYAIVAPDTLRAGTWRLRVRNEGPHEHHAAVARLAPGRSLKDVVTEPQASMPIFDVLGGTAGLAPEEANVLEITLGPGKYVLLCFVVDPATGREHYQMGMVRLLTVVP